MKKSGAEGARGKPGNRADSGCAPPVRADDIFVEDGGADAKPPCLWRGVRAGFMAPLAVMVMPEVLARIGQPPGREEAIEDISGFFPFPPKMVGGVAGEEQKGEFGMGGAFETPKRLRGDDGA